VLQRQGPLALKSQLEVLQQVQQVQPGPQVLERQARRRLGLKLLQA
jgi:hypothetical protein